MSALDELTGLLDFVIKTGSIVSVMDQGTDAVLDKIADSADDIIASYVPAYAVVRSQCTTIPGCGDRLTSLRRSLFQDIARVTGLRSIVAALVSAWKRMPAALRTVAGKFSADYLAKAQTITGLATSILDFDPARSWKYLQDHEAELISMVGHDYSKEVKDQVTDLYNGAMGAVLGPIESLPVLGPVAKGLVDVAKFTSDIMNSPLTLASSVIAAIPGGGAVAGAVGGIADCASDPVGCASGVVSDIGSFLGL